MEANCDKKMSTPPDTSSLGVDIPDEPNALFKWIGNHAPCFGISGEAVQVIPTPEEFYNILMKKAKSSKKRIILSSLYLGTGQLEQNLVHSIKEAVVGTSKDQEPVNVHVLLDCTRGSRGDISSRTMLLPLVEEFGSNVQVSLYHTPDLRGFSKKILPDRWNEIIGLQHIKIYIFDDDLIISGANLSESYFTNRQDRYMLFQDVPSLANYYDSLVKSISSMSFQLKKDNTLALHESNTLHPYTNSDAGKAFKEEFKNRITAVMNRQIPASSTSRTVFRLPFLDSISQSKPNTNLSKIDTWVYPLVQMGSFGIFNDDQVTNQFFRSAMSGSRLFLASGYFNLTDHYMDVIVNHSKTNFSVITAAPEANGFFGAEGVSGGIPAAYTLIAKEFYEKVCQKCQQQRISLFEYTNPGWTFHAKGLWYYLPGHSLPCVTSIGSPNYGYRSVYRDIESQMVVVTNNRRLKQQLHREQTSLFGKAEAVNKSTFTLASRTVPLWVRGITKFIRSFM